MKRIIYILISILIIFNSFGCNIGINQKRIISMNKLQMQAGQSKQNLDKYKSEIGKELINLNKELTENKEIYVTITFKNLLTDIQVSNLISEYNLKPAMILFRGIQKGSGMRATGATKINGTNDVTRIVHKPVDFRGFIELVADVKNKDLLSLATDENVYLVDPLADDYYISNRDRDYRKGMFWELEDLKLVESVSTQSDIVKREGE